ncbi:hypothetical protein O9993_01210 [Vibrio lentus]|nr:hypothetical protein [Vibrio lentus]
MRLKQLKTKNGLVGSSRETRTGDLGKPACGLQGKSPDTVKGMWRRPDNMAKMMDAKSDLQTGANTAWVPSPAGSFAYGTLYLQDGCTKPSERLRERV